MSLTTYSPTPVCLVTRVYIGLEWARFDSFKRHFDRRRKKRDFDRRRKKRDFRLNSLTPSRLSSGTPLYWLMYELEIKTCRVDAKTTGVVSDGERPRRGVRLDRLGVFTTECYPSLPLGPLKTVAAFFPGGSGWLRFRVVAIVELKSHAHGTAAMRAY